MTKEETFENTPTVDTPTVDTTTKRTEKHTETHGVCLDDLIKRTDAIDAIEERIKANGYGNVALVSELNRLYGYIRKLPSAQPERPKGHWIDTGSGQECSECGEVQYGYDNFRYYCAKCGAEMKGEEDGNQS